MTATYDRDTPLSTAEAVEVRRFDVGESAVRRTKRRYAHELYPHAEEFEVRPLAVEVPYLYAMALGFDLQDTGWYDVEPRSIAGDRTMYLIKSRELALIADAVLQGLTGDAAWSWAIERMDYEGEWVYERAEHYGVDMDRIKPYPCGPEPEHHDHLGPEDRRGFRLVTRMQGRESDCVECTEAAPA